MKQESKSKEFYRPIIEPFKKAIGIATIVYGADLAIRALVNVATVNNSFAEIDLLTSAALTGAGIIGLRNANNNQRK